MDPTQTRTLGTQRRQGHPAGPRRRVVRLAVPPGAGGGRGRGRPRRMGRGHPLLRHGALVRARPVRAAHRLRPALQAPRRVHPVDQDRPLSQGADPRLEHGPVARGRRPRRSTWSSTTRTTASCVPTSRASCASACQFYDVAVIHDLDFGYHQPAAKLQAYFDQLSTSGWRAIAGAQGVRATSRPSVPGSTTWGSSRDSWRSWISTSS